MSRPSRRAVLRGAATVLGASATLGAVGASAGCARDRDEPDPLEPLLVAARADAALAASAASVGGLAGVLGPVVTVRRAHADALATEIRRARPDRTAVVDTATSAAPAAPTDAAAARRAVADALAAAGTAATGLAVGASRYRCGLLGSVAAACAGLRETLG